MPAIRVGNITNAPIFVDQGGAVSAAIARYEAVMRRFPATDFANDAEVSIRSLREKIG